MNVLSPSLDTRLRALRQAQNPDGGWPYFAGKQSWLEPTVYAALALHGEPAADRAWNLLKSWQRPDGSWRPSADVQVENWATALAVTLATVRGEFGDMFQKGVNWLLRTEGVDANIVARVGEKLGWVNLGRNLDYHGWPWKPGTSSWVEPTAHTLVALKLASARIADPRLQARIRSGEGLLLDQRCRDGGWNYGNRSVLGGDLPSYPETTGIALLGLQGCAGLAESVAAASHMLLGPVSPLGGAWLTLGLRLQSVEVPPIETEPSPDLLLTAIEALSFGNWQFLRNEVRTS